MAASAAGSGGGAAYVGFRSATTRAAASVAHRAPASKRCTSIRATRTGPSSSVMWAGADSSRSRGPEAEDAEYMAITASVPNTTEVNGNHVIGNTQADQDDCGTTHLMIISDRWYLPWFNLTKAIPRIDDHLIQSRSAVDYKYSSSNDDAGGKYSPYHDEITFFSGGYFSLKVAAHEYGHALHNESSAGRGLPRTAMRLIAGPHGW